MKRGFRGHLRFAAPQYDPLAKIMFANNPTLTTAQKNAVNAFIAGARADGWLQKLEEMRLNVGSSITDYGYEVIHGVFQTAVNSPTYTATGTQFNGTSNYFRSALSPSTSTVISATSCSIFISFDPNLSPSAATLAGCLNSSNYMALTAGLVA